MKINIIQFSEAPTEIRGLIVVINVLRATGTVGHALKNGADGIYSTNSIELTYDLHRAKPGSILVGERNVKRPRNFHYDNSPAEIVGANVKGKKIIYSTMTAQVISRLPNTEKILLCGFVNVQATIDYIKTQNPEEVSLLCVGRGIIQRKSTVGDTLCAEYIKNALEGRPDDFEKIRATLMKDEHFAKAQSLLPPKDVELCLELDSLDFIIKGERQGKRLFYLEKG